MKYTNIKQAIMLTEKQDNYLREQAQGFPRHRALDTFRSMAAMEDSHYAMKGFSANLTVGQFVISTSELSKLWKCDRKTAISIIEEFNELGFLVSTTNNRTTLHSIQCICCWYVDELTMPIKNPFYQRDPICLTKAQRAALSKKVMTGKDSQDGKPTLSKDFLNHFVSLEAEKTLDDQASVVESGNEVSKPVAVQALPSSLPFNDTDSQVATGADAAAGNIIVDPDTQTPDQNHTADLVAGVSTPQQFEVSREVADGLHSNDGACTDREAEDPREGTCASPSDSGTI